jgi:antagonist of KipI
MAAIKVIKAGLLSTVQDAGREGYQQYGVPVSGVMDRYAYRVGNILVGNQKGEAVIEVTMMGFAAEFIEETVIAVTGGDLTPTLNGSPLAMWRAIRVRPGDKLAFQRVKSGCRSYLAVAGGIDVPKVMKSRSTYLRGGFGGFNGRALLKGDELEIGRPSPALRDLADRTLKKEAMEYPASLTVRVVPGPQKEAFTKAGIEAFYRETYQVTMESDRMGFRLEGAEISHQDQSEIISDGIAMGAVQIPGHGRPIIMMADRQTAGGYPKIGNVITCDLPKLAQAKPGDSVTFQQVTIEDAQEAFRKLENRLRQMEEQLKTREPAPQDSQSGEVEEELTQAAAEPTEEKRQTVKMPLKPQEKEAPQQPNSARQPGRTFLVRVNEKEYTVIVEKREE